MEGGVKVISRETVKPSSEIPHHCKKLKFSYMDQVLPQMYVPLIFFFQADESRGLTTSNHAQIFEQLKQSLSDCLPHFYPLAGRVKDNHAAVCNDAGVEFIEARVHALLTDVMQEPDMEDLKQYLPLDPSSVVGHGSRPLLLIQITFFDCGGVTIGACFSHKIADFASALSFIKAWAAMFRGEKPEKVSQLTFGTGSYFLSSRILSHSFSRISKFFLTKEKLFTRRFVFDKDHLALLKQAALSSSSSSATMVKDPTRVELISGFLWKHFIEATRSMKGGSKKQFVAFHAVNLKTRTKPPQLLENVFGNCVMASFAKVASDKHDFHYLVGKLRSSIRRVRGEYITKPLSKESALKDLFKVGILLIQGKIDWCFFTSWCGFPVYDVDYGWGKAAWFSTTAMPAKNPIVLVSTKSGDAIEAIVTMKQDVLAKMEAQFKLISTNRKN